MDGLCEDCVAKHSAGQPALFDLAPDWREKWSGMPRYEHRDLEPWQSIKVHFRNQRDRDEFGELVGQKITENLPAIWYPKAEIGRYRDKRYRTERAVVPRYPVYIISKGRWMSRLTSKALERIGVPYSIVVEPQEWEEYAAVIAPSKILTLPFSNLGLGSIPARNWVWEHAVESGAERHWILDDNIPAFMRYHQNLKCPVATGAIFRAAEDFTDRYENVALSGMNYFKFVTRKSATIKPFTLNTRIYSCILINNDLPHRWRGRYNEDTDLSLRVLKDGWCTILFNAFLCDKTTTMRMKGGNTEELYAGDGRRKMAEALQEQHPDIVKVTWKFNRWQHHVDYSQFRKNILRQREGIDIPEGADDYGMFLDIDEAARAEEEGNDV